MSLARKGSRQACALPHINKWCAGHAALMFPDPYGNLLGELPGNLFMDGRLMLAVSAVYILADSYDTWTPLNNAKLLEVAPALEGWEGREKHLPALCDFLNSIAEQVYVEWPATQAAKIAEKKALTAMYILADSYDTWTPLNNAKLLEVAPALEGWEGREKHLPALCDFLNSIAEQVYVEWPATQAAKIAEKKAKVDAKASAELTPAEVRKRMTALELIIKLMGSTFLDHQSTLAAIDLPVAQLEQSFKTTTRFRTLMRCADSPRDTAMQQLKKHNLLPKTPITLLDLPSEVRNRIYDIIAADMHPKGPGGRDRACIETYWNVKQGADQKLLVFPVAQVNKQLRSEFLPAWHRIIELMFDPDPAWDPNMTNAWLKIFGASRIPLTRSFRFEFGDDVVRVELRGASSRIGFGDSTYRVDAHLHPPEKSRTAALKDEVKVSSPAAWIVKRQVAREFREVDFEPQLQRFAEGLLVKGTDGAVHLTAEGVAKIMKYLRKRELPKEEECYPEECYPEECYPEECYPEECYPEECYPEECYPEEDDCVVM